MNPPDKYSQHTYSYLALRKAVGWIGILLPFVLVLGSWLIFKGKIIEPSISQYYHTGMGRVFVGSLCAIGLFMFFYSGYNQWDNWMGNAAGLFAIGLAWFPTTELGSNDWTGYVHLVCAAFFFITLACFSLFLFTKTKKRSTPTPRKLIRNGIYIGCGIIMIACLIAIVMYLNCFQDDNSESSFVFWAETVALLAFGFSWLTKGEALYRDKKK